MTSSRSPQFPRAGVLFRHELFRLSTAERPGPVIEELLMSFTPTPSPITAGSSERPGWLARAGSAAFGVCCHLSLAGCRGVSTPAQAGPSGR
jgi:hypothetical protein